MAFDSLRDFVQALDAAGQLKRVPIEIDPVLEITELADREMKSPGGGIPPYELENVLGRLILKELYEDDFLSFEMLSKPSAQLARS